MILDLIKAQTAESHQSLEACPMLQPLTQASLTLEQYHKILIKFYGYFKPVEEKISQFEEVHALLTDSNERRKAHWLYMDLKALGIKADPDEIPQSPFLPPVISPAQALGALYVLEGSTLGGRFIAKNVFQTLGLHTENGARFFNGYGGETGSKWKAFQQALVNFSLQYQQDTLVIEAARATFERFHFWLNQELDADK